MASLFSKDMPSQGVVAELIREVFAVAEKDVEFIFFPGSRAYREAELGRLDATAVWLKTPKREKTFYFSNSVLEEQHVFFSTEKITIKLTQRNNYMICILVVC